MQMKANKPGLVRLLRDQGQDIPSVQRTNFVSLWQAMGLQWADRHGTCHTAYLYLSTVHPALQIGGRTVEVTPEILAEYGLIEPEAQKRSPGAAEAADAEAHEDNMMIPQFAALCKG